MPYATNGDVRIHYETIGNGPVPVLHHGTFGSGADWIDLRYVDALKADHQAILPDSRGHGQSDKPHNPMAYDLALRCARSQPAGVLNVTNSRIMFPSAASDQLFG